jgi:hypothetical protein
LPGFLSRRHGLPNDEGSAMQKKWDAQVTVKVDEVTRAALEREGERQCTSYSAVARRVLHDWAKSLAEQPGPRMVASLMLAAGLLALCAAVSA